MVSFPWANISKVEERVQLLRHYWEYVGWLTIRVISVDDNGNCEYESGWLITYYSYQYW